MVELRNLLFATARDLGFDHVALLHHASLAQPAGSFIRIDNYPRAWASELSASGLWRHDPVHLASRRTNAIFDWSRVDRMIEIGAEQRWIMARSRDFDIGEGVTIPANVPGEPGGSCSFAVNRRATLPRERIDCVELIGVHAFEAARRLAHFPRLHERPHLSRREIECLRWIAAGKTDWETAVILGLSIETVRQYVKHARRAYNAVTRAQMVALGLRDDWVRFEDALSDLH